MKEISKGWTEQVIQGGKGGRNSDIETIQENIKNERSIIYWLRYL